MTDGRSGSCHDDDDDDDDADVETDGAECPSQKETSSFK